jgi:O-acetyl-ADP-ribose deacetylase (regulator of RNase III)
MDVTLVALCAAGAAFAAGIVLLLCYALVRRARYVYTGSFVAWCMLALAIVLLLFTLFPQSSVTGTFEGLKVGGAIAAFLVVVTWLARQGRIVLDKDRQVDTYETRLKDLRKQLSGTAKIGNQPQSQNEAPLAGATRYPYRTAWRPRRTIGLIAGNLSEVRRVDAWVNSENTNMQMASYYDRSISAVIRYYGSRRLRNGDVEDDVIGKSLRQELGDVQTVTAGTVIVTPPGELAGWGVKRIFHVAAVQGEPGHGYRPVQDLGRCVSRVLEGIDAENRAGQALRSVVFPVLGTGQARGNLADIFPVLLRAVLAYLRANETQLNEVWFVVYRQWELDACLQVLDREQDLTRADDPRAAARPLWAR